MQIHIRYTGKSSKGKLLFEIEKDGIRSRNKASLQSPWDIPVENSNMNLREGLQWYLEKFLTSPIDFCAVLSSSILKKEQSPPITREIALSLFIISIIKR